MIDDSNPEYRRARQRFEPVMARYRARAEEIRERAEERAEAIAEHERSMQEHLRAREEAEQHHEEQPHGTGAQASTPQPTRGRHAKPDEDELDEDDFSNFSFLR